ncbi:phage Gp37/Gp68 family protein [Solimonas marina]|uniref:Phage Gp37/Gp68 family protein n=1 Tax=Solimonas marina TaxID=2714601 RepID=A0A970B5B6_9GAMM|nr:phage Gp37/Gp68 family protein [Solimonas marina]NKF21533.1 phage Gp37/Gp68 family protein [Solimonas marina]
MSATTKIEWCDSTFNPWMGCTKVSPACDHCYAEARMDKRLHRVEWGAGKPRKRTRAKYWRDVRKMARRQFYECGTCGWRGDNPNTAGGSITDGLPSCPACDSLNIADARRRIFALSLGDWLDNEVPIEWLVDALDVIRTTPESDWLLLSKRIGNWHARITQAHQHCWRSNSELGLWLQEWLAGNPPANVWIGATVVNQEEADRDIPKLQRVPAAIRFLSIEPMLSGVDVSRYMWPVCGWWQGPFNSYREAKAAGAECGLKRQALVSADARFLDWIIAGGESGPHARPMHPDWLRSLRDQSAAAGVPFLFKQWGEWYPYYDRDNDDPDWRNVPKLDNQMGRGATRWINLAGGLGFHGDRLIAVRNVGKAAAGRLLDGREHNEFPAVLA